jgi:hypothetical protein
MSRLPERKQQILAAHAALIHQVVRAYRDTEELSRLQPMLEAAEANGWHELVQAIRRIIKGERTENLLANLDEEDSVIIESILGGIQNPDNLPPLDKAPDPALAAPGLASMLHAAARGDAEALQALGHMAEQMTTVGGPMARLGGIMRKLLDGERDPDVLCKGMDANARQLVHDILEELNRLSSH